MMNDDNITFRIKSWGHYQSRKDLYRMSFFRIETLMLQDPAIRRLSPSEIAVWIAVLTLAAMQHDQRKGKSLAGVVQTSYRDITGLVRVRGTFAQKALDKFQSLGLISELSRYESVLRTEQTIPNKTRVEENPQPPKKSQDKKSAPKKTKKTDLTFLMDLWNSICTSLPAIQGISDTRQKSIESRFKEHGSDPTFWQAYFHNIEQSDFLTGRKKDWKCTFDWCIRPTNMLKILEGSYTNHQAKGKKAAGAERGTKMTQKEFLGPFYNPEVHGDGDKVVVE